jgi:predicted phosphodiesterase
VKLHVLSDLHLEFAPFEVPDTGADVVLLAGDIGTKIDGVEFAQAIEKPVIYVAGNHEYYGGAIPHLTQKMRLLAEGSNVHFLENDAVVIDGVRFLGCTLWSDFAFLGEEKREAAMLYAQMRMNDYRKIRLSPEFSRLRAVHTAGYHAQSVHWLEKQLDVGHDGPTVVVTHNAPSIQSVQVEYQDDDLAPAFVTNLEHMMGERVALWVHGHTHYSVDYESNGTRVLSNQRGYPDESVAFEPELVIEV